MITLTFGGINRVADVETTPAPAFKIAGNFIHAEPSHQVVARYRNHQWQIERQFYSRYDCFKPTKIHFEAADGTRSEIFGPFERIFVADGTLYTGDELFAKFIDETLNWHSYKLETYWPILVISGAVDPSSHD